MRISTLLVLALFTACSGGGTGGAGDNPPPTGPGPTTPPAAPPSTATVQMRTDGDGYGGELNAFAPRSVTIAANGTVTWTNATGIAHNVSFTSGGPGNVADFTQGSQSRVFATTGTFGYQCTNHLEMTGEVVVQ